MSQRDLKFTHLNILYLLVLFLTLPIFVPASSAQNSSLRGLYLTGQYLYTGELPSEMEGLFSINLIAHDSRGRKAPLTGDVAVSGQEKYRFISAQLSGDQLTFTTRTIQSISYKFGGKVLKVRSTDGSVDEPELEGTLTKLRNGEKVGEVTGRFKYEEFGD